MDKKNLRRFQIYRNVLGGIFLVSVLILCIVLTTGLLKIYQGENAIDRNGERIFKKISIIDRLHHEANERNLFLNKAIYSNTRILPTDSSDKLLESYRATLIDTVEEKIFSDCVVKYRRLKQQEATLINLIRLKNRGETERSYIKNYSQAGTELHMSYNVLTQEVVSIAEKDLMTIRKNIDSLNKKISWSLLLISFTMVITGFLYKLFNKRAKSYRQQIERSNQNLKETFKLNPLPMYYFDPVDYKFVEVNDAAVDKYGYSREEFLNMTIMDIRPKEDIEKTYQSVLSIQSGKNPYTGLFRHYTKSKELRQVNIYSRQLNINNKNYVLVIAHDMTEYLNFEMQLAQAINTTQEEERYEIGSELHDNVCQILAASQMSLGSIKLPSENKKLDQALEYISMATAEIRNLSHRLAPVFFNNSNLEEAFENLANMFSRPGLEIHIQFDQDSKYYPFDRNTQLNLYRILQEQLRNIYKYAQATFIEIDLSIVDDLIVLKVSDNGIGFNLKNVKKGIGIANMERRAVSLGGSFTITSSPGKGCEIVATLPLA
ncbi:MAG: ATP-binding protein [Ginsengibacter sp.]